MYCILDNKKLTESLKHLPDVRNTTVEDIVELRKKNGLGFYLNKLLCSKSESNEEANVLLDRLILEIIRKK